MEYKVVAKWEQVAKGQVWEWRRGENWYRIKLTADKDSGDPGDRCWPGVVQAGSNMWKVHGMVVLEEIDLEYARLISSY